MTEGDMAEKYLKVSLTLRLIEASVLEEVLEVLEENNASPILIGQVKLALMGR